MTASTDNKLIEAMARGIAREDESDPDAVCLLTGEPQHRSWEWCAQAALQAITDAGYAVVPVEPTEAMIEVAIRRCVSGDELYGSIYKAMIEASQ
jgi:hypothetical protein